MTVHEYFLAVAQVWKKYFAGNLGSADRDRQRSDLWCRVEF